MNGLYTYYLLASKRSSRALLERKDITRYARQTKAGISKARLESILTNYKRKTT